MATVLATVACDAMFDAARAALIASKAPMPPEIAKTHGGLIAPYSLRLVKSKSASKQSRPFTPENILSIERNEVEMVMEGSGFERTNTTKKIVEYRSMHNGKFVYFRTEIGLPDFVRMVVHPADPTMSLTAVVGVEINSPKELQHGSNMTQFPMRKNKGKNEIHYGTAINVASITALSAFSAAFHRI